MVIVIHGQDSFRVQEKSKQLEEHFIKKFKNSGLNIDRFDAEEVPLTTARATILATPFLGEKRLTLVSQAHEWLEQDLTEMLERVTESTILVLKGDFSAKDVKAFQKALPLDGVFHEYGFEKPTPDDLKVLITSEAKKIGVTLAPRALSELLSRSPLDSGFVISELSALAAASGYSTITEKHVLEQLPPKIEDQIFQLMDELTLGNRRKAVSLLESQISFGSHPLQIMTMLARQSRIVLALSDAKNAGLNVEVAAKQLGVHPFVAKKMWAVASRASDSMRKILNDLIEFDAGIKCGRYQPEIALTLLFTK